MDFGSGNRGTGLVRTRRTLRRERNMFVEPRQRSAGREAPADAITPMRALTAPLKKTLELEYPS
jgi:hypothetical protein